MNEKMENCKVCNELIAKEAKSCPHCGAKNKVSVLKKWWLWLIIVVVVAVIAVLGSSDETTTTTSVEPTTTVQEESNEKAIEEQPINEIADKYIKISESEPTPFNVNEKAISFMAQNSNYFPGNESNKGAVSDLVDYEITYAHLTKNINKYGDKLINISGDVVDIRESDDGSVTYLHLSDYDGNNFIIYYLGSLENVFTGGYTWGYALPLDIVSFENLGGTYTKAVVCAGCYIYNEPENVG